MGSQEEATERGKKACILCGKEFPGSAEICPEDGTLLTPISREPKVGDIFAERYEILGTIGDGGMGKVYKARHNLMKRVVAIKMLLPHLVQNAAALKRFTQEAQAASALKHPHILYVHDFGISDQGIPFLVMDYLEGINLSTLLQEQGALPESRAVPIFIQACSALAHAHSKGVVHRDIKPANIMLIEYEGQPDYLQIVDFGIAKLLQPDGAEQLTHTGEVFGSPLYMSPEQCRGKDLDARSDIYSLGCVLYRCLTGRPVFGGRDAMECMYKQVNDVPSSFADICPELGISESLEAAVFKAIAKEPENRFQTMPQFREALEAARGVYPPVNRVFSVPPESDDVVDADAVTDRLKRPVNLMATQFAGAPKAKSEPVGAGESPVSTAGASGSSSSVTADPSSASAADPSTASAAEPSSASISTGSAGGSPASAKVADSSSSSAAHSGSAGFQPATTAAAGPSSASAADGSTGSPTSATQSSESAAPSVVSRSSAASGAAGPLNKNTIIGVAVVFAVLILGVAVISMSGKRDSDLPVPNTATGLSSKATTEVQKGDYQSAEKTLDKAAQEAATDAERLAVLMKQAKVYEESDKYPQAEKVLAETLEIQEKNKASKYDIARTKANLAVDLLEQGENDKAEPLLADAEKVLSTAPDSERHGLSQVYYGTSKIAVGQRDFKKAIKYLQSAIENKTKTAGPESPDLVQYLQDLAEIYLVQGKFDLSQASLEKELKICKDKFGPGSEQEADVLKGMALVCFKKGKVKDAEPLLTQSLAIKSKAFGTDSLAAAEIMATLAMVYTSERKYPQAEGLFKQALEIRTRELGADSPQAKRTKELYAVMQKEMKGKR